MNIVFDTNIIIDVLAKREAFYADSARALSATDGKTTFACITSNTVTDIFYIMRRYKIPPETIKDSLRKLFSLVEVLDVNAEDCKTALTTAMEDFEDSVLARCALRHSADYIVTRNATDFIGSPVPALTAPELCDLLEQNK